MRWPATAVPTSSVLGHIDWILPRLALSTVTLWSKRGRIRNCHPRMIDFESGSWIDFDSIVPGFRISPNAGDLEHQFIHVELRID